jgi:BirA family biotin operon repressor/biotin-[acetyl-CoA-carboxylase] ligase
MIIAFELIKKLSDGKFHSGQKLAQDLKINRAHIWRAVAYLKNLQLEIYSVRGKGYKLASSIELLNEQKIRENLTASALKSINLIQVLSVTNSTADYIREYKLRALPEKTVVVAEAQTKGRGRTGRNWFSPFGASIYLSTYWKLKQNISGLSLVIGLAVAKSLEASGICTKVKWPNDIYFGHKKMVGILIESEYNKNETAQNIFISIGLNVNLQVSNLKAYEKSEADLLDNTITDMTTVLGQTPSRNKIIADVLTNLVDFLEKFESNGFSYFLPMWEKYDYLMGQLVSVIKPTPNQTLVGQAKGVSQRGELLLEEQGVLKAICVGDIKVRGLS